MTLGGNVDVVILTALQDELNAVLSIEEGWSQERDLSGFPYWRRDLARPEKERPLVVAAAWLGKMGETAAAIRGGSLVRELAPACVAMCGICAGYRAEVALGDVIVADRLYSYDHGKIIEDAAGGAAFQHEIETYNLHPLWRMGAAYLSQEIDLASLQKARPLSREAQQRWLLHAQYAHEAEGETSPDKHPDRKSACADWAHRLREAVEDKLILMKGGTLALTDAGRDRVLEERLLHPDGLPADAALRIHVGTVATGKTVQEDPELFDRLRRIARTTIGVEMEGAAIGELAQEFAARGIVVKAVSNYGDRTKDDGYRTFACRASAAVLMAFLRKHVEPKDETRASARIAIGGKPNVAAERLRIDSRDDGDRSGGFLARVERVALLRDPGATVTRHGAAAPFAGVLEVAVPEGARFAIRVIGALDQPITEALLTAYQADVEHAFWRENRHLRSMLIHAGPQAPADLEALAWRRGVTLMSFAEYQGIHDFTRYLDWQTRRLEADPVYPPGLYVEQPALVSLAGGREEQTSGSALRTHRITLGVSRRAATSPFPRSTDRVRRAYTLSTIARGGWKGALFQRAPDEPPRAGSPSGTARGKEPGKITAKGAKGAKVGEDSCS